MALFELDPTVTEVTLNNSSFTGYSNYHEAIGFLTSDGSMYSLADDTLFRNSNKIHTFSGEYGIKWVMLYGTDYYTAIAHQNNWSTKYYININDNIPFLQQIKEVVIGNMAIGEFSIGAGSTENSIQSFIISELHRPISETYSTTYSAKPSTQGCFEKMPKLENFDAPGLVGFYFSSSPNHPFRESQLLTHFNIENLENYSGTDYGYVHFPTSKNDTASVSSFYHRESEKIKYVKLPKKQICTKCGFGLRLSRNYMDLRSWNYVPTQLCIYSYEVKWPSFKASSNSTGYAYAFHNAKIFNYEPGLEVYSLTFYKAEVLDFSNSCTLGYLYAYGAFDLNLSGITFKNANFGYAPRCERCIFPNHIESNVDVSNYYNLNKESLLDLLGKLPNRTELSAFTLTLNDRLRSKLTAEDLSIAINKNWIIK